jgi:hypothetical protein
VFSYFIAILANAALHRRSFAPGSGVLTFVGRTDMQQIWAQLVHSRAILLVCACKKSVKIAKHVHLEKAQKN